jgi:LPXTG-site transpeptidase (sortase) family protein
MGSQKIRRIIAVLAVPIVGFLIWAGWATRSPDEPKVTRILNSLDSAERNDGAKGPKALAEENSDRMQGDSPVAGSKEGKQIRFVIPEERYLPIGRLKIPEIDLEVAFRDGVHEDILVEGPGHWPGTPLPGEPGNAVLSGHRTTYTHPFGDLDLLELGDTVKAELRGENPVRFEVTKKTVVPESEYADFVLKQPKKPKVRSLTMFACHPKGFRTYRIVVQARAVPTHL